jgi:hypothetical protein
MPESISDKLRAIADELDNMINCPSKVTPALKRYTPVTPSIGSTLATGDVIFWDDNGTLANPNDTVDVFVFPIINGVSARITDGYLPQYDQGPSTSAGQYTLTNVPSGPIEVCFLEIFRDDNNEVIGTGEACCYLYSGSEVVLLKNLDFNVADTGPMTTQDFIDLFGADYQYAPNNPAYFQILNGALVAYHPAGQLATQAGACGVDVPTKQRYSLCQEITFDSDFDHGQGPGSLLPGKIGFGLGEVGNNGLAGGGNNYPDSWHIRPGFEDDQLTLYAYFQNNNPQFPPFGEQIGTGVNWARNHTFKFEIIVTMNTAGNSNGSITVNVTGTNGSSGTVTRNNVQFQVGNSGVDTISTNSFHGGGSSAAAPPTDTNVTYDNLELRCL